MYGRIAGGSSGAAGGAVLAHTGAGFPVLWAIIAAVAMLAAGGAALRLAPKFRRNR